MTCPVIFICYSEQDTESKEALTSHLNVLVRQGRLELWSDKDIPVGEKWKPAIFQAIDRSDIAILLVSDHFLNSDFIRDEELPRLLKRYEDKKLILFPILVSPCLWTEVEALKQLQIRPSEKQAVSDSHDPKRTYFELAREVVQIAKSKSEALNLAEPGQLKPLQMRQAAKFPARIVVLVVTVFVFWTVVVGSRIQKTISLKLEELTVDVRSPGQLSPNEDEVLDFYVEGNKSAVPGTVRLLTQGSGTVPCISLGKPDILNGEIPTHLVKKSLGVRCQWDMGQGMAYLGEVARLSVEAQGNGQSEAKDLRLPVALIPCIRRVQTVLGVLMIIFCCFGISIALRKLFEGLRFARRA